MRGVVALLLWASAAHATLDEAPGPQPLTALCEIVEICNAAGRCADFPALGVLALIETPDGLLMGQDEQSLRPIDRYSTLSDALPLPAPTAARRSFLVDLPPETADLRFAQYIQGFDPATGGPILRPCHFTLTCQIAPIPWH